MYGNVNFDEFNRSLNDLVDSLEKEDEEKKKRKRQEEIKRQQQEAKQKVAIETITKPLKPQELKPRILPTTPEQIQQYKPQPIAPVVTKEQPKGIVGKAKEFLFGKEKAPTGSQVVVKTDKKQYTADDTYLLAAESQRKTTEELNRTKERMVDEWLKIAKSNPRVLAEDQPIFAERPISKKESDRLTNLVKTSNDENLKNIIRTRLENNSWQNLSINTYGRAGKNKTIKDLEKLYKNQEYSINTYEEILNDGANDGDFREAIREGFGNPVESFKTIKYKLDLFKAMRKQAQNQPLTEVEQSAIQRASAQELEAVLDPKSKAYELGRFLAETPYYLLSYGVAKSVASKAGAKILGTEAISTLATKSPFLARTVAFLGGTTAATGTVFLPQALEKTLDYSVQNKEFVNSKDGDLLIKGLDAGKPLTEVALKDFPKAYAVTWVEVASESAGEGVNYLKKGLITKYVGKKAAQGIATKKAIDLAKKIGWDGILSELVEEEIAYAGQTIIEGEKLKAPFITKEGTERLIFETIAIGMLGTILQTPTNAYNKVQYNKAVNELKKQGKKIGMSDAEIEVQIEEIKNTLQTAQQEIAQPAVEEVTAEAPVIPEVTPTPVAEVAPEGVAEPVNIYTRDVISNIAVTSDNEDLKNFNLQLEFQDTPFNEDLTDQLTQEQKDLIDQEYAKYQQTTATMQAVEPLPTLQGKSNKETIELNEEAIRNTYKEKEDDVYVALNEILAEMEIAEAGIRVKTDVGPIVIPSTFPKWVPENLRSRKLFDAVMQTLNNIEDFKFPTGNRTAQRALYAEVLGSLDARLGLNNSARVNAIIDAYEKGIKQAPKTISKGVAGRKVTPRAAATEKEVAKKPKKILKPKAKAPAEAPIRAKPVMTQQEAAAEEKTKQESIKKETPEKEYVRKYIQSNFYNTDIIKFRNLGEQQKNLIVIHNTREENLLKSLDLSGFIVPSLAITKDEFGFDQFGEISLIGNPALAKDAYTADIYSQTFPTKFFKINEKEHERLLNKYKSYIEKYQDNLSRFSFNIKNNEGISKVVFSLQNSLALKAAFLETDRKIKVEPGYLEIYKTNYTKKQKEIIEKNKNFILSLDLRKDITEYKKGESIVSDLAKESAFKLTDLERSDFLLNPLNVIRYIEMLQEDIKNPVRYDNSLSGVNIDEAFKKNNIDQSDYYNWIIDEFSPIFSDAYFINKNKTKKGWNKENILREMKGNPQAASAFGGLSYIRAAVAKKLKTIKDIKGRSDQIVSYEEESAAKNQLEEELEKLYLETQRKSETDLEELYFNQYTYLLGQIGPNITKEGVTNILENDMGVTDKEFINKTYDFLIKVQEAPTDYFELKPQRQVLLNEFSAVLIPSDASQKVRKELQKYNVPIFEYNPNKASDRREKLNAITTSLDIKFRVKEDVKTFSGKEISEKEKQEILKLNFKIFKDEKINFVTNIMANQKALGASFGDMIAIVTGQVDPKDTFYHEAVHKYLRLFMSEDELVDLFVAGMKKYKTKDLKLVEEKIAEDFIKYARKREGFTGTIRKIFDTALSRINAYLDNKDEIDDLYQRILAPKKKVLPSKKKVLPSKKKAAVTKAAPTGAIAKVVPVGEGKKVESALAKRIKEQLLLSNPARYELDEKTATYNKLSLEDDAQKAVKYLAENPSDAIAVSLGLKKPPVGQTANAIGLATAFKAREEGNYGLYSDIINSVSLRSTRMGQEIVSLRGQFNDDSAENYVKRLIDKKVEKMAGNLVTLAELTGRKKQAKEKSMERINKETTELQSKLQKDQVKIRKAQDIIDALRC